MGTLTMTFDERDPGRVRLAGDASTPPRPADMDAAIALLSTRPSGLVVEVGEVSAPGPALLALLNELGARAASAGSMVVLELVDDDWLATAPLGPGLRIERIQVATAASAAPRTQAIAAELIDGTARTGRGYITSYGKGRLCSALGCTTTLSRYNSNGVCWLHGSDASGRRR